MKRFCLLVMLTICLQVESQTSIEKWKVFEISLKGPSAGNPFMDTDLQGFFVKGKDTIKAMGFYDGNGIYKIRFMPQSTGKRNYYTVSNNKSLNGKKGVLSCIPSSNRNHGPVIVADTFSFSYSDGSPYIPVGTTSYAWVHQGDSLANVTLKTLSQGYFNKMRMCIFPKDYAWSKNEPLFYPFEGKPMKDWDYTRFNPAYFRNIERRIEQLDSLGIEADLIVFHPYDRWGFSAMTRETDDRYIKYVIARLAAYKNVWWSMANEYDFMREKKMSDWDHFIEMFATLDPYHHLLSIHNGSVWYDHTNPLITHASIQSEETEKTPVYKTKYKKPIVYDECRYEGNVPWSWGNLTPQKMTEKFWKGFITGGFVGHGETYVTEKNIVLPYESKDQLWWAKGGDLKGQSPERIKFLKQIIESAPAGLKPVKPLFASWMPYHMLGIENEYYLVYLNDDQPRSFLMKLPEGKNFSVEVIDTWNMTITPLQRTFSGSSMIELPGESYVALRIVRGK